MEHAFNESENSSSIQRPYDDSNSGATERNVDALTSAAAAAPSIEIVPVNPFLVTVEQQAQYQYQQQLQQQPYVRLEEEYEQSQQRGAPQDCLHDAAAAAAATSRPCPNVDIYCEPKMRSDNENDNAANETSKPPPVSEILVQIRDNLHDDDDDETVVSTISMATRGSTLTRAASLVSRQPGDVSWLPPHSQKLPPKQAAPRKIGAIAQQGNDLALAKTSSYAKQELTNAYHEKSHAAAAPGTATCVGFNSPRKCDSTSSEKKALSYAQHELANAWNEKSQAAAAAGTATSVGFMTSPRKSLEKNATAAAGNMHSSSPRYCREKPGFHAKQELTSAYTSKATLEANATEGVSTMTTSVNATTTEYAASASDSDVAATSALYETRTTTNRPLSSSILPTTQLLDPAALHQPDAQHGPTNSDPLYASRQSLDDNSSATTTISLGAGTTVSATCLAVAHAVPPTADEERDLFRQQVRRDLLHETARAEPVQLMISPLQVEQGHSGSTTPTSNCSPVHNHWMGGRYHRVKVRLLALLLAALIAAIVGVVLQIQGSKQNTDTEMGAKPSAATNNSPSLAPSPEAAAAIYLDDGRQAIVSTQQLYDAVDAYILAVEEEEENDKEPVQSSEVASTYGYPIGTWDVSRLSDFSRVFNLKRNQPIDTETRLASYSSFNEDLSGWNVSNAVTVYGMFAGCADYVGEGLERWDTSRVQDFSFMFLYTDSFVGHSIASWNTSSATRMFGTFRFASAFNGDLSSWDVSRVDSMAHMFSYTPSYEGTAGTSLSRWNVSRVRDMSSMFEQAHLFNANVSSWDVGNVELMDSMFMFSLSFNGDLERWDVGRVKSFAFTFGFTESFQGLGLSAWNTSRVQTLSQTFEASSAFDANLSRWDVARVVDFSNAFNSAKAFTGKGLSRWNTSSAEAMWRMFMSTPLFSADLSSWDVGNVVEMTEMFAHTLAFNGDLSSWNVSRVSDLTGMFIGAKAFDHGLCAWGSRLSPNVKVLGMFNYTSCETMSSPSTANLALGPFCQRCDQ